MVDDTPLLNDASQTVDDAFGNVCFLIAPIGQPDSPERRRLTGLSSILRAILPAVNLKLVCPHEIPEAGSITEQVIEALYSSRLVVADLTGLNPNVMYELAIRHCVGKAIVTIAADDTVLPFDLGTERTIFYTNDVLGANELIVNLGPAIAATLARPFHPNPVNKAVGTAGLQRFVWNQRVDAAFWALFNRYSYPPEVPSPPPSSQVGGSQSRVNGSRSIPWRFAIIEGGDANANSLASDLSSTSGIDAVAIETDRASGERFLVISSAVDPRSLADMSLISHHCQVAIDLARVIPSQADDLPGSPTSAKSA